MDLTCLRSLSLSLFLRGILTIEYLRLRNSSVEELIFFFLTQCSSQNYLTASTHILALVLRTVNVHHYRVAFLRVDLGNELWLYDPVKKSDCHMLSICFVVTLF